MGSHVRHVGEQIKTGFRRQKWKEFVVVVVVVVDLFGCGFLAQAARGKSQECLGNCIVVGGISVPVLYAAVAIEENHSLTKESTPTEPVGHPLDVRPSCPDLRVYYQ